MILGVVSWQPSPYYSIVLINKGVRIEWCFSTCVLTPAAPAFPGDWLDRQRSDLPKPPGFVDSADYFVDPADYSVIYSSVSTLA